MIGNDTRCVRSRGTLFTYVYNKPDSILYKCACLECHAEYAWVFSRMDLDLALVDPRAWRFNSIWAAIGQSCPHAAAMRQG